MKKTNWKKIKCDSCGQKLDSEFDLCLWNEHWDGENQIIDELTFRHGRGKGCDSKQYLKSNHMKDDFDFILQLWKDQIK